MSRKAASRPPVTSAVTGRRATGKPKARRPGTAGRAAASKEPKAPKPEPVPAWRRVGRVQLAELLGVHPDTVSDYTKAGMPALQARGGRGRENVYDAAACLKWQRNQEGRGALEAAQTRQAEARALQIEQALDLQNGQVVLREEVIAAGQAQIKGWTSQVRALPRRAVQLGVVPRDAEVGLADLCREILTEISKWQAIGDIEKSIKARDAESAA